MAGPNSKSPAFQFYPGDFLSDSKVMLMSNAAVGCYIKLLCHCWNDGSISTKIEDIAKLCGEHADAMAMLWESIETCFKTHPKDDTKLIHPRLDKERKKQKENRKRRVSAGKKGAKARWESDGNATDLPMAKNGLSSSSSSSSSTTVIKKHPGEKKPAKKPGEIQDTTKALRAWVSEFEKQLNDNPNLEHARDNTILKKLVDTHGLEKVLSKIPHHIAGREYLSIPGFQTVFNSLGISKVGKPTQAGANLETIKNWGENNGSTGVSDGNEHAVNDRIAEGTGGATGSVVPPSPEPIEW
jgi:uncharacterized protein YdaU (DUF1376 family)